MYSLPSYRKAIVLRMASPSLRAGPGQARLRGGTASKQQLMGHKILCDEVKYHLLSSGAVSKR